MATGVTSIVRQGTPQTGMHVCEVEATADGDTTIAIPHGLGEAPEIVHIEMLVAAARISNWIVTGRTTTTVTLTKTTTAGSGAAGAQIRAAIMRPHSLSA